MSQLLSRACALVVTILLHSTVYAQSAAGQTKPSDAPANGAVETGATTTVDPKFDKLIADVKTILRSSSRPDVRQVFPAMLPVSAGLEDKVTDKASYFFTARYSTAGAMSMNSAGKVVFGRSSNYGTQRYADERALQSCESRRNGSASLPKCEVFLRSRTVDKGVILNMLENARGPNFDAWVKGLDASAVDW